MFHRLRPLLLLGIGCGVGCASSGVVPAALTGAPRPGAPMPSDASPVAVVHRGGDLCSHSVRRGGVEYNFDVACGASTILYVQTLDRAFRSPEGLSIGEPLRKALAIPGSIMLKDQGCGVLLPSGWVAHSNQERQPPCNGLLETPIIYFDSRAGDGGA